MADERRDGTGTQHFREDTIAAREAVRVSEREEIARHPSGATLQRILIGAVAVLVALLSMLAVWMKT